MTQTHTLILFTWTLLQAFAVADTADTCALPIDNAVNIRLLQAAVEDLTSKVTTQQQDLGNLKTDALKNAVSALEKDVSALKTQNSDLTSQLRDLKSKVTTQKQELGNLKSDVVPKVAFSASLVDRSYVRLGPAASQTLVFKRVLINNGNAYNPATGYFTASHKGAYLFTFTTHSGSTSYNSGAHLMKNGQLQVSTWERKGEDSTMSGAVILSLNARDKVNVVTWGGSFQVYDSGYHYTTFSGFLLFPL